MCGFLSCSATMSARLARDIHDTVAGFMRGQLIICIILAVFYATALRLTGLSHALVIGIAAGLFSFVPYFGLGFGILVSLCVAVSQFWPNWGPIVLVGLIFLVGRDACRLRAVAAHHRLPRANSIPSG